MYWTHSLSNSHCFHACSYIRECLTPVCSLDQLEHFSSRPNLFRLTVCPYLCACACFIGARGYHSSVSVAANYPGRSWTYHEPASTLGRPRRWRRYQATRYRILWSERNADWLADHKGTWHEDPELCSVSHSERAEHSGKPCAGSGARGGGITGLRDEVLDMRTCWMK